MKTDQPTERLGARTGDRANIHFANGERMMDVEVLYVPQAVGDSWIVRYDGKPCYVMQFETITIL